MKIRMIKDGIAYPDGKTRTEYKKGKTYDVVESIGWFFVAVKKAAKVMGKKKAS